MSNDHTFEIKVTVDADSAEELQSMLSKALGDEPYERKTILSYNHFRNLGVIAAGRYGKSVEEILQEVAAAFPGAEIDMSWENEFGQEGGDTFHVSSDEDPKLPTPKTIDVTFAERFLENPDSYDLSKATSITDEAAEVLSEHEGGLALDGLTELSNDAIESLSKHQGEFLYLDGLTELSDAAVDSLSKHPGDLTLNGLTELSDAAAEVLAKHEGVLSLDGLTELSDAAAEALAKHEGVLSLDGLTELSDAAAEALAKHEGVLSLDGIKRLPLPLASFFASLAGNEEDEVWVDLNGLDSLDKEAARLLSAGKFHALCFNGLKEIAPNVISAFAGYNGYLGLGGLTALSDELSAALAQHKGRLGLDGVNELSDSAAEALSNFEGEDIGLYGLETLSARGAGFLLGAKGDVSTMLDLEALAGGDDEGDDEDEEEWED